ncbi:MAG: IS200/IS605 family transposase [Bacteroidaceae bacterium]|nr:IS200/IS605 family transposase [Bacteroidaceae bacterium]
MSFTQFIYHLVFPTKNRENTISIEGEKSLYKILYNIMKQEGAHVHRIGGMPDHVHILVEIPANISISKFVQKVKQESSYLAKEAIELPLWDGWAEGYGGFTYSANDIETVKRYIMNQKEHHRKITFIEEYRVWLIENGISTDAPFFPK